MLRSSERYAQAIRRRQAALRAAREHRLESERQEAEASKAFQEILQLESEMIREALGVREDKACETCRGRGVGASYSDPGRLCHACDGKGERP
jgi:hypothetical protein